MTSYRVPDDAAGQRLDVWLASTLGVARSRAAARISRGEVTVDARPASKHHRLRAGASVVVLEPAASPTSPPPPLPPVRYRDEHLLVVAKPAGLVVHPGAGHHGDTLVDALRAAGVPLATAGGAERPGIVHRLDRDTSGLLMVASSDRAYDGLVAALRERSIDRRYLTLVAGVPASPVGRIEAPIGRHPRWRTRFAVVADGRAAVTRYRTVATGRLEVGGGQPVEVALLVCRLETGRTHQIRVHLRELGHPVLGDPTYGPRQPAAAELGLDRPALHAALLAFQHPVTGEQLRLVEPLPAPLERLAERLGITAGPAQLATWLR